MARLRREWRNGSLHAMEKMISALGLNHALVRELQIRGFHTLADFTSLSALEAIGVKWMNGHQWQIICEALGRKPFPDLR